MELTDLELLLTHFSAEKEYIDGGYYRLREKGENQYEIAFLMPDSCGTTTVNPQITVVVEAGQVTPLTLLDLYRTPVRNLTYTEETALAIEQALTELVAKFKEAKKIG